MKKEKKLTKLEAVKFLAGFDHCFISSEVIKKIVEPFGYDPKNFIGKYQDRRSEFKGLYVPSVKEGDWVEGNDAANLAEQLCIAQKVEYTHMFGRGSALRECCEALEEHLKK